jgi:hypothetical protein
MSGVYDFDRTLRDRVQQVPLQVLPDGVPPSHPIILILLLHVLHAIQDELVRTIVLYCMTFTTSQSISLTLY